MYDVGEEGGDELGKALEGRVDSDGNEPDGRKCRRKDSHGFAEVLLDADGMQPRVYVMSAEQAVVKHVTTHG